jgi:hypothetical protein
LITAFKYHLKEYVTIHYLPVTFCDFFYLIELDYEYGQKLRRRVNDENTDRERG